MDSTAPSYLVKSAQEVISTHLALFDSGTGFRDALESLSTGVVICDHEGIIRYVNRAMEEITGYGRNEAIGKAESQFIYTEGAKDPTDLIQEMERRKRLRDEGISSKYIVRIQRKNGEVRWLETRGSPLRDADGKVIGSIGLSTVLSDQRELEEHFQRDQKMDALARMAGGIAHDFRNLLAIVAGNAEYMLDSFPADSEHHEALEAILAATKSAGTLTDQLFTISGKQIVGSDAIHLGEELQDCLKFARNILGPEIELETEADPSAPHFVRMSAGQFHQILINLVKNAGEAISPGKGTVRIVIDALKVEAHNALRHPRLELGEYIVMSVRDNGAGMSDHVRERLFDPFFTTKQHGTGLGLATLYSIVKQHRGEVTVNSRSGSGTEFRVYLPRAGKP